MGADLIPFTEEILSGKLPFLCIVLRVVWLCSVIVSNASRRVMMKGVPKLTAKSS